MTDDDDGRTPVGFRRGSPKNMTIIMYTVVVVIVVVAIVQWIRV